MTWPPRREASTSSLRATSRRRRPGMSPRCQDRISSPPNGNCRPQPHMKVAAPHQASPSETTQRQARWMMQANYIFDGLDTLDGHLAPETIVEYCRDGLAL